MLTRLRGRMAAAASATLRDDRSRAPRHCREGLADLQRHRRLLGSTEPGSWPPRMVSSSDRSPCAR